MNDSTSPLRRFRTERGLSLDEIAGTLGVHKTTALRIENGELPADADMVERITRLTAGAVTADDMHAVRLTWLKANRPEKFASSPAGPDASQAGAGTGLEAAE